MYENFQNLVQNAPPIQPFESFIIDLDFETSGQSCDDLMAADDDSDESEEEKHADTPGGDQDDEKALEPDPQIDEYCYCKKPQGRGYMIECSKCTNWFHKKCLGYSTSRWRREIELTEWFCKECTPDAHDAGEEGDDEVRVR